MDYRGQTRGRFERRQLQFAQAVAKHPKMQSALSRKAIDGPYAVHIRERCDRSRCTFRIRWRAQSSIPLTDHGRYNPRAAEMAVYKRALCLCTDLV
jgi:hypothetical protein